MNKFDIESYVRPVQYKHKRNSRIMLVIGEGIVGEEVHVIYIGGGGFPMVFTMEESKFAENHTYFGEVETMGL